MLYWLCYTAIIKTKALQYRTYRYMATGEHKVNLITVLERRMGDNIARRHEPAMLSSYKHYII